MGFLGTCRQSWGLAYLAIDWLATSLDRRTGEWAGGRASVDSLAGWKTEF